MEHMKAPVAPFATTEAFPIGFSFLRHRIGASQLNIRPLGVRGRGIVALIVWSSVVSFKPRPLHSQGQAASVAPKAAPNGIMCRGAFCHSRALVCPPCGVGEPVCMLEPHSAL
jgi:hypothetical protein